MNHLNQTEGWATFIGWKSLESRLNNAPVQPGEPVLLFHKVGGGENYMLLFRMPGLSEKQFQIIREQSNETYSIRLEGPSFSGYRIDEDMHNKVSRPCRFSTDKDGFYDLPDGMTEIDTFILAFGKDGINYLMEEAQNIDELRFRLKIPNYSDGVREVLVRL